MTEKESKSEAASVEFVGLAEGTKYEEIWKIRNYYLELK